MTAEENIALPLLLDRQRVDTARVEYLLDLLHIRGVRRHLPAQLSGGQQQRVAIARALIAEPALVLADEPTGNLDSTAAQETMALLQHGVRETGRTLIVVTHDEDLAGEADRMLTMVDGCVVGDRRLRP